MSLCVPGVGYRNTRVTAFKRNSSVTPNMVRRRCRACGTSFEASRRGAFFCSATCRVRSWRKFGSVPNRGGIEPAFPNFSRRRACARCGTRFMATRSGHRFCSAACRVGSWRKRVARSPAALEARRWKRERRRRRSDVFRRNRPLPDRLRSIQPEGRAKTAVEIHTDAGGGTPFFSGFEAIRVRDEEELQRSSWASNSDDVTGAEGEALLKAAEWALKARAEGRIARDETITLCNDNIPVVTKTRERRAWGKHSVTWDALYSAVVELKKTGPAYVREIPRGINLADEVVSRAVMANRERRREGRRGSGPAPNPNRENLPTS